MKLYANVSILSQDVALTERFARARAARFAAQRVGALVVDLRVAKIEREIRDALAWAVQASNKRRVPALVEIMCEREVNAAMGLSIDRINEYEPILDGTREMAGQIVGGVPERD